MSGSSGTSASRRNEVSRQGLAQSMKFAHFSHVWGKPGMTPHQRYEQLWRELELADAIGFESGFCVEHHFRPDESWISSPSLYCVGAGARTERLRIGAMGYIVPLHDPLRLAEDIAIVDQMLGGRLEVGLVTGIDPAYFAPFGIDFAERKQVTLEYVDYLRAAYGEQQPFDFRGECLTAAGVTLAVQPAQRPHPPFWMMSRDPPTLEFCARNGINTGYFFVFPRSEAAPRYRQFLADWDSAGWQRKPDIAYSTVVYVDETDAAAIDTALARAGRAYEGFLPPAEPGQSFEDRVAIFSARFEGRGESGAAEIMRNAFNAEYLLANDLIFVGSAETVAEKLHAAASAGVFNTFMGEFNFADLPEARLMRSIRLFGEKVIPALAGHSPY